MKVTLLAYTPTPEKIVAAAARCCYSNDDPDKLLDAMTDEKAAAFLQKLNDLGHQSPVEHVSFTFAISGVSRALLAQITRHRLASFSVRSQRYCGFNNADFIKPPSIDRTDNHADNCNDNRSDRADNHVDNCSDNRSDRADNHADNCSDNRSDRADNHVDDVNRIYGDALVDAKSNYDALIAAGIAKEDARMLLPNAAATSMVVTMNARELLHFFSLRCCARAQWEIRAVANDMVKLVKPIAPNLFAKAGAACVQLGYCPEGKFSCGRAPTLEKIISVYRRRNVNSSTTAADK